MISTLRFLTSALLFSWFCGNGLTAQQPNITAHQRPIPSLREVNEVARPDAGKVVAIVGATLIDGRGGAPIADAAVVIRAPKAPR